MSAARTAAGVVTMALVASACRRDEPAPAPLTFEAAARPLAPVAASDPSIVARASGELFALSVRPAATAAGGSGFDLVLSRSADGGDTYTGAQTINAVPGSVRAHHGGTPRLLLDEHARFSAVWTDADGLQIARSTDYGATFQPPALVDTYGKPPSFYDAALAPDGTVIVAWLGAAPDRPAAASGTSWVSIAAARDGVHFGAPIAVAASVCPCCRPAIAADAHGRWFLAFRQVHGDGARDIALVESADRGAHWSAPALISDDGWKIDGCPHSGPALAIAGDRLYAAWYAEAEGVPRLYWSRRALGAPAFEPRRALSGALLDPNQPALATDGDAVFAAFQARAPAADGPWGPPGIYVVRVGGDAWVRAPDGSDSARAPTLVSLGASRWLVAWTDGGDRPAVRVARARGTSAPP